MDPVSSTDGERALAPFALPVSDVTQSARASITEIDTRSNAAARASDAAAEDGTRPAGEAEDRVARVRRKAQALFDRLTDGAMRPYARLSLDKDEETGTPVYKVIDSRNGDVIRQWPLEEALAVAREFDTPEGLVVDERA